MRSVAIIGRRGGALAALLAHIAGARPIAIRVVAADTVEAAGDSDVAVILSTESDAAARLVAQQSPGRDVVIVLADDAGAALARSLSARGERLHKLAPGVCMDMRRWPGLQGQDDASVALAAITVCRVLGIDEAAIDAGLQSFPGVLEEAA